MAGDIAVERPPAPRGELRIEVGDDDVRRFREQGFLAIERITTDEEIAWLDRVWNERFSDRRLWFDVSRPFGAFEDERLGQIIHPEKRVPALRETLYFRNARRIASKLLGRDEGGIEAWGHFVLKPARQGHATPWHQDESYWDPALDYHAVASWLPLEDVDGRNGCMRFLPGSHRNAVLPHRHVGGDARVHLLELDQAVDEAAAVDVPLSVGGATFHHYRTVHATAGNATDRPRRAFANEFQTPPVPRAQRAARAWLDEARRAWAERAARGARSRS